MKLPFFKRGGDDAPSAQAVARREPKLVRRSYRAAYPDRLANGFSLFTTNTNREETRREIRGLVNHSRHAAHNFDFARGYEMLFRRHVIGWNGIRLQMDVRDAPDRKDKVANALIEAGWRKWGKMGSPTICGRLSWWGVECQMATGIAREGGSFLRFHRGAGRGPFGFQVEPIPFDLLDLDLTQPAPGGNFIESGIEFNADGRVMAFHIWNIHASEGHRIGNRRRLRIPADQMIYVLVPEEIGQALGVPRSATALRLMNMGEKFQESAMTAANYGAAQMVFFQQQDTSGQLTSADDAEVPIEEIEAGTMATLPPGVTAVPHTPHYPDAAVEPFMRHMGTSQAAGLGVAYETLTADLSRANFSSLRAGKGEERDEWRMMQRAVYEGLHDQVFARWLPMAMLSGQVRLPLDKLEKFQAATWRPRGWASVNPKDDATANANDLSSGARSLTEIVADRGRSLDDVLDERAAEVQAFTARNLPVPDWAGVEDDGVPGDTDASQPQGRMT
ncbi:MAG: phage portal protein [Pseudomonadota bacterium]